MSINESYLETKITENSHTSISVNIYLELFFCRQTFLPFVQLTRYPLFPLPHILLILSEKSVVEIVSKNLSTCISIGPFKDFRITGFITVTNYSLLWKD